jgi:uncharacterized Tic20 family protein
MEAHMNELIPLKARLLAAGYFIISSSHVAISLLAVIALTGGLSIFTLIVYLTIGLYVLLLIAISAAWVTNRETDPFLDISRKEAINHALSNLLAIVLCSLLCIFVFLTTCGIGNSDLMPLIISFLVFAVVMVAYLINSIVAAIFALRGYTFKSFLIYPFIKYE